MSLLQRLRAAGYRVMFVCYDDNAADLSPEEYEHNLCANPFCPHQE